MYCEAASKREVPYNQAERKEILDIAVGGSNLVGRDMYMHEGGRNMIPD